jgi:hypothetical protein
MTLVQRLVEPQLVGRREHVGGGTTAYTDPTATCTCTDPDVHRLIELINSGMSQVEASRLLWGDGGRSSAPEPTPAPVVVQRPAAAPVVTPTSSPGARFPWLRRAKAGR